MARRNNMDVIPKNRAGIQLDLKFRHGIGEAAGDAIDLLLIETNGWIFEFCSHVLAKFWIMWLAGQRAALGCFGCGAEFAEVGRPDFSGP
jgi:hypothetical protein